MRCTATVLSISSAPLLHFNDMSANVNEESMTGIENWTLTESSVLPMA